MQEGRAKATRLITIFVVCSLLIVLALVWIFTDGTLYRNRILEVSGPWNDRSLGAVSISTEANGSSSIKNSNDVPTFETSSNSEAGRNAVAADDDFEEIYIPRRYSPFFGEEGPVPNSYTTSRELQLSVNCLPTYEEALNALQPESWNPSGSDTSTQDNNLIIFM